MDTTAINFMKKISNSDVLISCHNKQTCTSLLEKISKSLRERKISVNTTKPLGVSDDIHISTRALHKELLNSAKSLREKGYSAFVPLFTPRVLKYKKKGTNGPYRILKQGDPVPE